MKPDEEEALAQFTTATERLTEAFRNLAETAKRVGKSIGEWAEDSDGGERKE